MSADQVRTFTVTDEDDGIRLDRWFRRNLPEASFGTIARWSRTLGPEVTVLSFPGAMHDVSLSRPEIRDEMFTQLFSWAERAVMSPA